MLQFLGQAKKWSFRLQALAMLMYPSEIGYRRASALFELVNSPGLTDEIKTLTIPFLLRKNPNLIFDVLCYGQTKV